MRSILKGNSEQISISTEKGSDAFAAFSIRKILCWRPAGVHPAGVNNHNIYENFIFLTECPDEKKMPV